MVNLFGEELPTGSPRQQLEQVQQAQGYKNGAELFRAWAKYFYSDLNEYQLRQIVTMDRAARDYFNN